ncbi:MAG: hypothetical protein K2G61_05470 [Bacteroidaceae bacterium]|nr:hypothetical protein [Bacteroidaceae bacterium]
MPEHVLLNIFQEPVAVHTFLHADHHAEAVNRQSPTSLQTEDGGIRCLIVEVPDVGKHGIYLAQAAMLHLRRAQRGQLQPYPQVLAALVPNLM